MTAWKPFLRFACTIFVTVSATCVCVAQDLNTFERVLVPISVGSVPGAYGSIWSTELWYRNNSNRPVAMFPVAISDWVPAVGRTAFLPIGNFPASAPGTILFVERNGGDQVQFDLRLFNRAAPQAAWGTKLPVVREREFVESVNLVNVPTSGDFRCALRVYGLPEDTFIGQVIEVRVYSYDEKLLASTELTFEGWPRYAAMLSLADVFPQLRQVDRVRLQIEPRDTKSKIWAFVSVVANATQEVSLVTPD